MHYSLCDFLMDAVQNSVEAGASLVKVNWLEEEGYLTMRIQDDGSGMTPQELERAQDPFYSDGKKHAHRKVGLGLPFLKQTIEMTEGEFEIRSQKGSGTVLEAVFKTEHLDTPPVGDLTGSFFSCLILEGDYEMEIRRVFAKDGRDWEYTLLKSELVEVLGDLSDASNLGLLREYLISQEEG